MKAVITAGAPLDKKFAERAGTAFKALARVRGKTMLARTIEAARGAGIDGIAVVCPDDVRATCERNVEKIIPDTGTGSGNVLAALDAWPGDERLLYLTCDMPYVSAQALRSFIDVVPADTLSMALSDFDAFVKRFPECPPFGITLNGETVVNGGAFLIPAGAASRIRSFATQLFEARKAPWKMASITGLPLLLRFLVGRLAIRDLEERATSVLGIRCIGARDCAPELGYDADILSEYEYALAHE